MRHPGGKVMGFDGTAGALDERRRRHPHHVVVVVVVVVVVGQRAVARATELFAVFAAANSAIVEISVRSSALACPQTGDRCARPQMLSWSHEHSQDLSAVEPTPALPFAAIAR
jgi:hypothetical protein